MKKKRIVTNDKSKIAATIKELDERKNEALRNAWQKVNKVRTVRLTLTWFHKTPINLILE